MNKTCTIEVCLQGEWQILGQVRLNGDEVLGIGAATAFEYDDVYAFECLTATDLRAASCRLPVILGPCRQAAWPPFLLDLIPSGAGRRFWEERLQLPNSCTSDWALLCAGAMNPPGNLRVREAAADLEICLHDGFARADVLVKSDRFLSYAQHNGVAVTGSSGAQGDAPKMLLTERHDGRWQPSGTVAAPLAVRDWIIKLPRGSSPRDREILAAEKVYYDIAGVMGLAVAGPLTWECDCLFIPRFDVTYESGLAIRSGLESLASASGVSAFAIPLSLETQVDTLRRHSTSPTADIAEFLARDVLNVAMGNTDNHGRNSALLKRPDGTVRLAPLYDFAPMMVDPAMIPRACKWSPDLDRAGYPDWGGVVAATARNLPERTLFIDRLKAVGTRLVDIPSRLEAGDVAPHIIERVAERCAAVSADLAKL